MKKFREEVICLIFIQYTRVHVPCTIHAQITLHKLHVTQSDKDPSKKVVKSKQHHVLLQSTHMKVV